MAFGFYALLEAALLVVNAIAILNKDRFLSKIGWTKDHTSFQDTSNTTKSQLVNLISSVQTVMRAQRTMEQEFRRVSTVAGELQQILAKPKVGVEEMNGAVGSLLERLTTLKRKASEAVEEECSAANLLKKRLSHLKVATNPGTDPKELSSWKQCRIDRFLVDYLLRSGHYDSASRLADETGTAYLCNSDNFMKAKEVEESLALGDTSKWCDWAMDNKSKLKRLKSGLELKIRRQEFVELIKQGKRLDAVNFARKHFSELSADQWPGLTPTMGLLAFDGSQTKIPHYKNMLAEDCWKSLVEEFKCENLRVHHLNQSVFSALLQSGLSAMKTPRCISTQKERCFADALDGYCALDSSTPARSLVLGVVDLAPQPLATFPSLTATTTSSRAAACPLCRGVAGDLAAPLPAAHASQSHLVCAYSGEPVNDSNLPMMLPNGMVYGQNSILAIAAKNQGKIVCPRTKKIYELKEAERVFVM